MGNENEITLTNTSNNQLEAFAAHGACAICVRRTAENGSAGYSYVLSREEQIRLRDYLNALIGGDR